MSCTVLDVLASFVHRVLPMFCVSLQNVCSIHTQFICMLPYLLLFEDVFMKDVTLRERMSLRHTLHMSDLKSEKSSKPLTKMDLAHWTPKRLSRSCVLSASLPSSPQ